MLLLRNLAFYLAFYLGSTVIVVGVAAMLALGSRRRFRVLVDCWPRWHRWCLTRLLGIQVEVEGEVPRGAVLVALKHESFMEAIELPLFLPNPAVFVKQELMRIPGWGYVARSYGLIEVARDQGARALRHMFAAARERSSEGRPVAIFPEGTRVPRGTCPPLQSGFAGLYKVLAVPVVPVAVQSGVCYHQAFKRKGTIRLRFGEPIPPGLPRAEIEARVHAAINHFNLPIPA